jgi:hypothetical protein
VFGSDHSVQLLWWPSIVDQGGMFPTVNFSPQEYCLQKLESMFKNPDSIGRKSKENSFFGTQESALAP